MMDARSTWPRQQDRVWTLRPARVYPTRVAVIRTVSKFMTNEPP